MAWFYERQYFLPYTWQQVNHGLIQEKKKTKNVQHAETEKSKAVASGVLRPFLVMVY